MRTPQRIHGSACSDAERRDALSLHAALRKAGHEAWVETLWVRPQDAWSRALHAILAIVASLLAPSEPLAAAVVAGVVTLSAVAEAAGRTGPLRLLFYRRATQIVLVEPQEPDRVALWIVARTDVPRRGTMLHGLRARIESSLVPNAGAWNALAIAVIAAAAAARAAGVDDQAIGLLQFIPTTALLLVAAAALDTATGPQSTPDEEGVANALELYEQLVLDPPDHFSPALVLTGAHPHALRAHLRRERPDPALTVVLECAGAAEPTLNTRHPQLAHAALEAEIPVLRASGPSRRLPSARLQGLDLDASLALVDELDAQLGANV